MEAMSERDQLELLTGPDAAALLAQALGTEGARLETWSVHSLHHRPAAGVTVGYSLTVRGLDGSVSSQYVCASTARLSCADAPGLVRLERPDLPVQVHVWRHPNDPELPALPMACDPAAMSALLGRPVAVQMVGYRPTRRCVLRLLERDRPTAFLKVVRPRALPDLAARHELLAAAGVPAPRVVHSEPTGLAVLSVVTGTPLAQYLARGLADPEATFAAVNAVLDALPAGALDLQRHPSWSERVAHYAHAAATALPEAAAEAERIATAVEAAMADSDPGPVVPTHGDWYEANIVMADETHVRSVLDVDSVGPGYRVDDLACLLAHMSVLPHLAPQVYPRVPEILERWWRVAQRQVDARALAARCAAVTLSLVAGARKPAGEAWRADANGRLAEAARWLELMESAAAGG